MFQYGLGQALARKYDGDTGRVGSDYLGSDLAASIGGGDVLMLIEISVAWERDLIHS